MIGRADPHADDDTLIEYRVDPDADPGNVIPTLARLLIDLAHRQNETSGPAMAARFPNLVPPDRASREAPHDEPHYTP
jgi:hypothetical protein